MKRVCRSVSGTETLASCTIEQPSITEPDAALRRQRQAPLVPLSISFWKSSIAMPK